jgi:hypothetical protein
MIPTQWLLKGFKKEDGNGTYDACIVLTNDFRIRLHFGKQTKATKAANIPCIEFYH